MKSVLITGCSAGGIGYALAKSFQSRGLLVFATARNLETLSTLESLSDVHLLKLDVTSADDVAAAVKAVQSICGKLDFLVNNSGQQLLAPTIETDIEQGKKLYDVNFWGVLRICQAFLPLLIEAKGTVVNIGSICAVLHAPFMGVYNSSKAAGSMLGENLRIELAPLGVKVLTVMTGSVDTPINGKSSAKLSHESLYLECQDYLVKLQKNQHRASPVKPEIYAAGVVNDILKGATGKIWRGDSAFAARILPQILPTSMVDSILLKGTDLDKVKS